jgi:hypothetical protein
MQGNGYVEDCRWFDDRMKGPLAAVRKSLLGPSLHSPQCSIIPAIVALSVKMIVKS